MSVPATRMLRVRELLQSAQTRTVSELARLLDVDERTVRRYVRHLVDQDIPVETIRGHHGGYRLAAGYRMPPLILSDEETIAVILGLIRAQSAADAPGIATTSSPVPVAGNSSLSTPTSTKSARSAWTASAAPGHCRVPSLPRPRATPHSG